jgi:hypothetical protein
MRGEPTGKRILIDVPSAASSSTIAIAISVSSV